MKITVVPAQTVGSDAATETLTGRFGRTAMTTAFETAGLSVKHGVASDVRTQEMLFPSSGANEKVLLFVPTFDPLTFHW